MRKMMGWGEKERENELKEKIEISREWETILEATTKV